MLVTLVGPRCRSATSLGKLLSLVCETATTLGMPALFVFDGLLLLLLLLVMLPFPVCHVVVDFIRAGLRRRILLLLLQSCFAQR